MTIERLQELYKKSKQYTWDNLDRVIDCHQTVKEGVTTGKTIQERDKAYKQAVDFLLHYQANFEFVRVCEDHGIHLTSL